MRQRRARAKADRRRCDVVVVGPFPPPVHGAAVVTESLARALGRRGHAVAVDTAVGVPRRRLTYHPRRLVRHAAAAMRIIRSRASAAVYIACPGGAGVWYSAFIVLVARSTRRRVVLHHHSFAYVDRSTRGMRLLTRIGGDRLIHVYLCDAMRRRFTARYPRARGGIVCSNAGFLAGDRVANTGTRHGRGLVVGHLGNLSLEKGLGDVVETAVRLREHHGEARLRLAGPAHDPEAAAILDSTRAVLGADLVYDGRVDGPGKEAFFASIDVFLLPSRYVHEAEPLVVLEALHAGVPVVATARGCIPEVVGAAGLVVAEVEDFAAEAAGLLRRMADEPAFAADLRANALARAEQLASEASTATARLVDLMVADGGR